MTKITAFNCIKTKVTVSVLNITHRLIDVSRRKTSLPGIIVLSYYLGQQLSLFRFTAVGAVWDQTTMFVNKMQ